MIHNSFMDDLQTNQAEATQKTPPPTSYNRKVVALAIVTGLAVTVVGALNLFFLLNGADLGNTTKIKKARGNDLPTQNLDADNKKSPPETNPAIDKKLDPLLRTRNLVRLTDVSALIEAIEEYAKDNNHFPNGLPSISTPIAKNGADICSALVPEYISSLPRDPQQKFDPTNEYSMGGYVSDCNSDYVTGFEIVANGNKVIISAPFTEQAPVIMESLTRP